VLKGDKQLAATHNGLVPESEIVSTFGWAPFNGEGGQVRAAPNASPQPATHRPRLGSAAIALA
jgi:hypothetical protein